MNYITTILKKLVPTEVIVGRWKIEKCNLIMNRKVDLSNEDHCGPCGQHVLEKIELKNIKNTVIYLEK